MSERETPPQEDDNPIEEIEEFSSYDIVRMTLACPPYATTRNTTVSLPCANKLMQELLLAFQDCPIPLNELMSLVSSWAKYFPNDTSWMSKCMQVETQWFDNYYSLAENVYRFDNQFGQESIDITGDVAAENVEVVENISLDLAIARSTMGPIYLASLICRFKRSKASSGLKFNSQFSHLVKICLAAHETNVRISKERLNLNQSLQEYRTLISKSIQMEYTPSEDEIADTFESDRTRLFRIDLIYMISQGQSHVGCRLMPKVLPHVDQPVSEDDGDDAEEDEPATVDSSVSQGTRSQSNRQLSRKLVELEKRIENIEKRFDTLRGPSRSDRPRSSSSNGSRKRSRSPDDAKQPRKRNFMVASRTRKRQQGGRHNKSSSE